MIKDISSSLARWLFPAALLGYFVFYLSAFSVPGHFLGKRFAVGDDFEYVSTIKGSIMPRLDLIEDPGDVKKHPLFPLIAVPLYRLGLCLFSNVSSQANLARTFPFALMGLINLVISHRIFLLVFEKWRLRTSAKMLTLLYGSCFSFWIFSMNVETYIMTTLFQNLFFWYCIKSEKEHPNTFVLGLLFSLCLLASAAMIWMSVSVLMLFYCKHKDFKTVFLKSIGVFFVAGLITGATYIFYDLFYHFHHMPTAGGFDPKAIALFSVDYLGRWLRWDLHNVFLLMRAFFVDSLVYTRLSTNLFLSSAFWILISYLLVTSALGIWRERAKLPASFKIFIGFEGAYAAFFCFFSPESCVLYSLPALLPFLIILFLGFSLSKVRFSHPAVVVLLVGVVLVSNVGTYFSILKFKNFNLKVFQYAQVEKLSYDRVLSQFEA
ncbi:MAG: hypothetical protein WCJ71_07560 [Candidatus Omnitrophota bacterium]